MKRTLRLSRSRQQGNNRQDIVEVLIAGELVVCNVIDQGCRIVNIQVQLLGRVDAGGVDLPSGWVHRNSSGRTGGSRWIGRSSGNRNAVGIVISSQDIILSVQPESDRETVNIGANAQRVDHIGSPDQREARRFLSAALELGRRVAIQKIDLLAEEAGRNPLSGVDEAKDHAELRPQGCRVIDREDIHFLTCRAPIDLKSNRQPIAIKKRAIS